MSGKFFGFTKVEKKAAQKSAELQQEAETHGRELRLERNKKRDERNLRIRQEIQGRAEIANYNSWRRTGNPHVTR
jgi:hypothetical protein